mmetsp:Transcript_18383/g.28386  ORF Transcript_18383/g.28386 Transcript_18383/m.28386 type:complete len:148 (-) Transcript_18383:54-497(-)
MLYRKLQSWLRPGGPRKAIKRFLRWTSKLLKFLFNLNNCGNALFLQMPKFGLPYKRANERTNERKNERTQKRSIVMATSGAPARRAQNSLQLRDLFCDSKGPIKARLQGLSLNHIPSNGLLVASMISCTLGEWHRAYVSNETFKISF